MKRILILAVLMMAACSGKDWISSRAEHFVRNTYNDVDRIFSVRIDTVTLGDNLDYRIEQTRRNMEFAAMMFRDYGGKMYEEDLMKYRTRIASLDSLKAASADILGTPAAYNCIVVYNDPSNTPGNLVCVQLDPYGNLLNITKDPEKVLLNPGGDVPGYLQIVGK